ncbi:MAG: MFS transporter [Muribaculaceae bacterium]|nr:MFS transporter [Roseburia sp.]MCM1429980.1 MFS transporter [Muribaculaceae bacterium]MCM1492993.1 MFS transporter [Muribaculaceae bacterium]
MADKHKTITLLSGGLFDKSFMDSKVRTRSISTKELILGHLIGPLGLIFVVNTIAALVEKFFTQQTGAMYGTENMDMVQKMGGYYEVIMTVAKLLAIAAGLFNGWLMQHTKSRQGRMRPWHLIFGFISIIIGGLIFLFPGTTLGESYWYYFFILLICYHTVGSSYFYLFRDTICSLITRDPVEKTKVKFIRQMSWTLISGMIIGMLINMVVLPMWLEHDITGYAKLLIVLSVAAVPLLLLEYFYTKERVIEDVAQEVGLDNENRIPLRDQIKALLTNKYYVIFMILMTVGGIVDNFKGGNVQYFYVKFLLGGDRNPLMFTLYQVITGIPLGLGAIVIYPLAKKFGIKNISIAGFSMVLLGSIIGWLFPGNVTIAMIAGFLRQTGMLPNAYVTATLLCFAFDSVEFKSGLRLEGLLGVSIITAIQAGIYAPFAGGFESTILKLGFVDVAGVTPNTDVIRFMTLAFYLFDIILAVVYLVLLPFMDVEKHLPEINLELERRRKEAVLARGEEWVEPEERERREKEQAAREHEENRIADLKEYCRKKGLDFEEENAKYLAKAEAKRVKKEAKR